MEILKFLAKECSDGDIKVTLTYYGKAIFAFWALIWIEVIELAEIFGAKVN